MKAPAQYAQAREDHPVLPKGNCERVSGYGVMGLPFASGHILGRRRWTASSVGDRFTSVWHRDPTGRWTFYESVPCQVACSRYFGNDVERFVKVRGVEGVQDDAGNEGCHRVTSLRSAKRAGRRGFRLVD
jgi:hypothetical protein